MINPTQKITATSSGYIAIVSAIILSLILTTLALSESTFVFWTRASEVSHIRHIQTAALADSCEYEALLAYVSEGASLTPSILSVWPTTSPGETCTLMRIVPHSSGVDLFVRSSEDHAVVIHKATILTNGTKPQITTWREVSSIPP